MITTDSLIEFFASSADSYRFFSQAMLRELNEEAIEILASADLPTDTGNECLDKGYSLIKRYFKFSESDRRSQLACEYARVFLAAGVYTKDKRAAIPYESVFTSEEHLMMQEARDQVVDQYIQDGFQVNPDLHEPEDHLSFELEYLAEMNRRAAGLVRLEDGQGLQRNIRRQADFIQRHLLNWVPELRAIAGEYARVTFYIGFLLVVQGTLQQSLAMLGAVSEALVNGIPDAAQA